MKGKTMRDYVPQIGDRVLVMSYKVPCEGIYMVGTVVEQCKYMYLIEYEVETRRWFRKKIGKVRHWHTHWATRPGDIIGPVTNYSCKELERIVGLK